MDEESGAGGTEAIWDGRDQTGALERSGVYFARLTVTDAGGILKFSKVNKLLMLK